MDYATLPTREGQTGPCAPSYFVEVPQYRTWDTWCTGLHARFEPFVASITALQKLRTWRQIRSVQDYTSGFLALCEQVGYMHESERIDCYIGGLKHDIAQEIQLRGVTDFREILAMAEKLNFFRRPRPGSFGSNNNWGHQSRGMNEGTTIRADTANSAAALFKGRCFACNRPRHRQSECPENAKGKGEDEQQKQTKQQGNTLADGPSTDRSRRSPDPTDPHRVIVPVHAIDHTWPNKEGTMVDSPILLSGKIGTDLVKIFVDGGASHSLINTATARKLRLPLDKCLPEIDARLVDGTPLAIRERVDQVRIRCGAGADVYAVDIREAEAADSNGSDSNGGASSSLDSNGSSTTSLEDSSLASLSSSSSSASASSAPPPPAASPESSSTNSVALYVGIAAGVVVVILLVVALVLLYIYLRQRRTGNKDFAPIKDASADGREGDYGTAHVAAAAGYAVGNPGKKGGGGKGVFGRLWQGAGKVADL
ncbi:unnamed protein product, partial [Closterium sp. NIES-53]